MNGRLFALTSLATFAAAGLGPVAEAAQWRVPRDFPTIQAAIDDHRVHDGDVITLRPGRYFGATLTKGVQVRGRGAVIVDGPRPWATRPDWNAGFLFPGEGAGSGATLQGLRFRGVAFPVYSRGADDVSVLRCRLAQPIQGVTNWGAGGWGNGWIVVENRIVGLRSDCGGGIGILVGDFAGGVVRDGVVAHNVIRGWLRPSEDECGGYAGSGVVAYADFRWGLAGAQVIEGIRIAKNRVALASVAPWVVDVVAIELTDSRDDATLEPVIVQNEVVYNDLSGTRLPLVLTPPELSAVNRIESNLTHTDLDSATSDLADRSLGPPERGRPFSRPIR